MITIDAINMPWGAFSYRRTGHGTPLLLLHPLALNSQLWEPVLEDFIPGHDIIMPDFRGHGDSTWDGADFTIDDLAIDIRHLLDALGIERCRMLGMSMGGSTALSFATTCSERLDRLMLCDTTAWYGEDALEKWEGRARMAQNEDRRQLIPFQVDRWFSKNFRQANPDNVNRVAEIFLATDPSAHAKACLAMGRLDVRERLHKINVPTLVVTGEEDYATPPVMGRALVDAIPDARFRIWPTVRHMAVLESASLRAELAQFARLGSSGA